MANRIYQVIARGGALVYPASTMIAATSDKKALEQGEKWAKRIMGESLEVWHHKSNRQVRQVS